MQPQDEPLDGMYLQLARAEMIIRLFVEDSSVATVERVTGVHHGTILKLLVLVGEKCERIMAENIRNVEVRDLELDELWASSARNRSASGPKMTKTSATATRLSRLKGTANWL